LEKKKEDPQLFEEGSEERSEPNSRLRFDRYLMKASRLPKMTTTTTNMNPMAKFAAVVEASSAPRQAGQAIKKEAREERLMIEDSAAVS